MVQFIYGSTVFPEFLTMESSMRIQAKRTNVVAGAYHIIKLFISISHDRAYKSQRNAF